MNTVNTYVDKWLTADPCEQIVKNYPTCPDGLLDYVDEVRYTLCFSSSLDVTIRASDLAVESADSRLLVAWASDVADHRLMELFQELKDEIAAKLVTIEEKSGGDDEDEWMPAKEAKLFAHEFFEIDLTYSDINKLSEKKHFRFRTRVNNRRDVHLATFVRYLAREKAEAMAMKEAQEKSDAALDAIAKKREEERAAQSPRPVNLD